MDIPSTESEKVVDESFRTLGPARRDSSRRSSWMCDLPTWRVSLISSQSPDATEMSFESWVMREEKGVADSGILFSYLLSRISLFPIESLSLVTLFASTLQHRQLEMRLQILAFRSTGN